MSPEREAALQAVVDRQLEIERKARAWDLLHSKATALAKRGRVTDELHGLIVKAMEMTLEKA